MSETSNNEMPKQEFLNPIKTDYSGIVYTGDRSIARGTNIAGEELPLSKFLSEKGLNIAENDEKYPIDRVYFKTETGNVYGFRRTDKGGEIINAKEGIITSIITEERKNNPLIIKIGESFCYQQSEGDFPLHTSKVTEVVAISKIIKSDTEVQNMAKGKETSILNDFRNLIKESKQK
jgi:hypothetical protein